MRSLSSIALFLIATFSQGAEPKLTKEMGKKVVEGRGKLTEAEVLKMVPGTFKAERTNGGTDLKLTWDEATSFRVDLVNGKVESITAEFNDTAVSKKLTIDKFKQIKIGMTQMELEQLLGGPNGSSSFVDEMKITRTKCSWSEGRRLFAFIKDGKVDGGGFVEGDFP
jgi:hypothetical protein